MALRVMRVIAGSAKGRRLKGPAGRDTRPMMDRVKEALFSSLGDRVAGAAVLDLYAGSGSLGIEALSRGAASATFVENSRAALSALRSNLTAADLEGSVMSSDVRAFLDRVVDRFDLVFIDPPYRLSLALLEEVLAAAASVLGIGGMMIVHRRASDPHPGAPPGTRRRDERRYGDTRLFIFERIDP